MIATIHWQGDHDGHVVFRRDTDGEASEIFIDRPGDMVTAIQAHQFPSEKHKCAAAVYGVCLAMRGVTEPHFIPQILEKAIPFLAAADVESIHMHRTMQDLKAFITASGVVGFALRDRVLDEAHRIHASASATA